jgi:hypothetical protein
MSIEIVLKTIKCRAEEPGHVDTHARTDVREALVPWVDREPEVASANRAANDRSLVLPDGHMCDDDVTLIKVPWITIASDTG